MVRNTTKNQSTRGGVKVTAKKFVKGEYEIKNISLEQYEKLADEIIDFGNANKINIQTAYDEKNQIMYLRYAIVKLTYTECDSYFKLLKCISENKGYKNKYNFQLKGEKL